MTDIVVSKQWWISIYSKWESKILHGYEMDKAVYCSGVKKNYNLV